MVKPLSSACRQAKRGLQSGRKRAATPPRGWLAGKRSSSGLYSAKRALENGSPQCCQFTSLPRRP